MGKPIARLLIVFEEKCVLLANKRQTLFLEADTKKSYIKTSGYTS